MWSTTSGSPHVAFVQPTALWLLPCHNPALCITYSALVVVLTACRLSLNHHSPLVYYLTAHQLSLHSTLAVPHSIPAITLQHSSCLSQYSGCPPQHTGCYLAAFQLFYSHCSLSVSFQLIGSCHTAHWLFYLLAKSSTLAYTSAATCCLNQF